MTEPQRSILITGCSTGIGYHAAHGLKERGWRVFATARKPADVDRLADEGLESMRLDYADEPSIGAAVDHVLKETGGRLDALFNNGGYAQAGAIEDLETDHLRTQFQANVFGWHDLTRRVIPVMRRQGSGRIVFCSSILGLVGGRYRGAYVATKHAIEGYADTLRIELHGTGIAVILIEPGPIASNFRVNAVDNAGRTIDLERSVHDDAYRHYMAGRDKGRAKGSFRLGPEAVLKKLVHALESKRPRARYPVTLPAHVGGLLKRALPTRAMDRILGARGTHGPKT